MRECQSLGKLDDMSSLLCLYTYISMIRNANSERHHLSTVTPSDFEFIQVTGKVAQVPNTTLDFQWNGNAIKTLSGVYMLSDKRFSETCTGIHSLYLNQIVTVTLKYQCQPVDVKYQQAVL